MPSVIGLPAIPGFSAGSWRLERNVAAFVNPLGSTTQREERTGYRWRCALQCPTYRDDDAGVLTAWLDQVSRGDRFLYLSPPQNSVRGNWNPLDLVTNGTFRTGLTTGWTANLSTLSVNARRMRVVNSGAAVGDARQNLTMEASKPHVLLADSFFGKVANARVVVARQSDSVVEADTGAQTAPARSALLVTPTVAGMRVELRTNTSVSGDSVLYGGVSVARCLQVNGASQTGNRLIVDGGPTSINAALKAGEFVSLRVGNRWQMVRLSEDFDSDATGAGTLVFEPALRASPADNAAVIVRNPFARFMLSDSISDTQMSGASFRGFAVDAVEDPTELAGEFV